MAQTHVSRSKVEPNGLHHKVTITRGFIAKWDGKWHHTQHTYYKVNRRTLARWHMVMSRIASMEATYTVNPFFFLHYQEA
jgi:hypothetical protein